MPNPADRIATALSGMKEREGKATRGPWAVREWKMMPPDKTVGIESTSIERGCVVAFMRDTLHGSLDRARTDAAFIAAARTDLPRLVEAVEYLLGEMTTPMCGHEDAELDCRSCEVLARVAAILDAEEGTNG
jgi:hypothetical protein